MEKLSPWEPVSSSLMASWAAPEGSEVGPDLAGDGGPLLSASCTHTGRPLKRVPWRGRAHSQGSASAGRPGSGSGSGSSTSVPCRAGLSFENEQRNE